MHFSPADIHRLYGERIFLLPAQETAAAAPLAASRPEPPLPDPRIALLSAGAAIAWKMKPQARAALVLHAAEFADRSLTALLKDWILAAGLAPEAAGFGVAQEAAGPWDLSSLPVPLGVAWLDLPGGPGTVALPSGQRVLVLGSIASLRAQPEPAIALLRAFLAA
jgi:hypothetical protein